MRTSVQAFAMICLVATSIYASSAFTYASLEPRTVETTIVSDQDAYLTVTSVDTDFACYVAFTNGKIDVDWDGGTSCGGSSDGTGVNPDSTYYFHDVIRVTNRGTKTLTNLWLNMSAGSRITINTATAANVMKTDDSPGYELSKAPTTNLAPGQSWFIGFKIDATGLDTTGSISSTLRVEARYES